MQLAMALARSPVMWLDGPVMCSMASDWAVSIADLSTRVRSLTAIDGKDRVFDGRCSRIGIASAPVRPAFQGGRHRSECFCPDPHPMRPLRCGVSPLCHSPKFLKSKFPSTSGVHSGRTEAQLDRFGWSSWREVVSVVLWLRRAL